MKNHEWMTSRHLAGRVLRYHTHPTIHKPNVAEHVARVATIYCDLWGIPRGEVLYYILNHDNGEMFSGDNPYYAKRAVPYLRDAVNEAEKIGYGNLGITMPKLTDDEFRRFKVADLLEMFEFGVIEVNMGNKYGLNIVQNVKDGVMPMAEAIGQSAVIKVKEFMHTGGPIL